MSTSALTPQSPSVTGFASPRNAILFAVMCIVWGLTWLPVKIGAAHVPPVFLAAARFCIAGIAMMAWAGRDLFKVPAQARWRLVWTALLLNTGNYSFLFWGASHAPTGLAAIVNFATIPIYSLVASRAIEGTPIGRRQIAAIGLGILGLGFLFATRALGGLSADQRDPLEIWGLASIALGTLLYCVGAVFARRIAGTVPTLTLASWQTAIGGIGLAAVSLAMEPVGTAQFQALLAWPVWPCVLFLAVGGSLMGFTIYLRLLRDWGAFRAGLYAFVSPAIAVAAGVAILSEPFGAAEAVGALLMFAAAAIALRR